MATRREIIGIVFAAPIAGMTNQGEALAQPNFLHDASGSDWHSSPDERIFEEYKICFSKGLKHGFEGYPDPKAYANFCAAIKTRDLTALERMKASVPWVDPIAGDKISSADVLRLLGGRWWGTKVMLGDVAEVYWASLCRDIPFSNYHRNELVDRAQDELRRIDSARFSSSPFKINMPGMADGGYLSQFLIKPVPINGAGLAQRISCPTASNDFLMAIESWAECQNGVPTRSITTYLDVPRYVFNGRALAEFVRHDFVFQAFLWAALILQSWGRRAVNPSLAAHYIENSTSFVNNGWAEVFALLAEASHRALRDAWFWKWRVFRRLRPEEFAGRYAFAANETFAVDELRKLDALEALSTSKAKFGTAYLPQAYPEGSPLHPSFPAGHAGIAGACVTILKAFTDPAALIPSPVTPSLDGLDVVSFKKDLSIEGELNKLAWNIAFGRSFAGIHYRSDHQAGLLLGEDIALQLLAERAREIVRAKSTVRLRRFDGTWTSVLV
jgi:hypothetical protein